MEDVCFSHFCKMFESCSKPDKDSEESAETEAVDDMEEAVQLANEDDGEVLNAAQEDEEDEEAKFHFILTYRNEGPVC